MQADFQKTSKKKKKKVKIVAEITTATLPGLSCSLYVRSSNLLVVHFSSNIPMLWTLT